MRQISEAGFVGEGGKLMVPMDRVRQFFRREVKKGSRVIIRFIVVEPGSTEAQQAYYYNYIVPSVQRGLLETGMRLNEDRTDEFLVGEYPGDKKMLEGHHAIYARELNEGQMSDFLDWLKQFAAENLNVYIEDARVI